VRAAVAFCAGAVHASRWISAADYAKLVGVARLTVYNWEKGKSRPRQAQLEALAGVRGLGKREAIARLEGAKAPRKRSKKA